jgi:hypothetical protein
MQRADGAWTVAALIDFIFVAALQAAKELVSSHLFEGS